MSTETSENNVQGKFHCQSIDFVIETKLVTQLNIDILIFFYYFFILFFHYKTNYWNCFAWIES